MSNRLIIKFVMKSKYPIHLGSRIEGNTAKILYAKVYDELRPIIPSQTIKGIFRHLASKLAKNIKFEKELTNLVIESHNKAVHCPDNVSCEKFLLEKFKLSYDRSEDNIINKSLSKFVNIGGIESKKEVIELFLSLQCPICRLFGAKNLSSKTIFTDALISGDYETSYYRGISIDRKYRTVREKHVYTIERVTGDYSVEFEAIVDNINEEEMKVLCILLSYIEKIGMELGGSKSRGYGRLKLDMDNSKYAYINLDDVENKFEEYIEGHRNYKPLSTLRELICL